MAAYILHKILYLTIYFIFKRSLSVCHIVQGHSQWVLIDLGCHFQNCKHFLEYFGFYLYQQLLFILQSYNDKSKFSFLQTVQAGRNTSYLPMSNFCAKCWYLARPPYFEKITVEKLFKVLEMNLKCTSQSSQNSFSIK